MKKICEKINEEIGSLFECSDFKSYTRVQTPFVYPDGDIIDIFYKEDSTNKIVTDLGGACDWLNIQSASRNRSEKQEKLLEQICINHRVDFIKGSFFINLNQEKENRSVTEAIIDLSQAVARVSDLWFTQTSRRKKSILDIVEDFIKRNNIQYSREESFLGESETTWKQHFYTQYSDIVFLIYVLSTDNKGSTSGILYKTHTAWYDLQYLKKPKRLKFMSLFDDRYEVWTAKDRKLLKDFSILQQWSDQEGFKQTLMGINI